MRLPGASSGGLACAHAQGMRTQHATLNADNKARTAPLPEICSTMHVAKCHYCARVGETLKYVAEQYNFDTNWLRLWNYNFQLTDPVLSPPLHRRPPLALCPPFFAHIPPLFQLPAPRFTLSSLRVRASMCWRRLCAGGICPRAAADEG